MSDMGLFRITIGVESTRERGAIVHVPDALVDTGSEYTWVPRAFLEDIGVGVEKRRSFNVADGRWVEREVGYAILHAAGTTTIDEVVFAEENDFAILGAHSLEGMNLRVDPVRKALIDAGPILAVSAA